MWPWEHFAVGYIAYSLLCRARGRDPNAGEVVALAVGTQFPDIVDKPLGWGTTLLPSGTSLAHSVFVAVPLSVAIVFLARRHERRRLGVAFGIGYLLHLPADVLYGAMLRGEVVVAKVLWPLVTGAAMEPTSLVGRTFELAGETAAVATATGGYPLILFEICLLSAAMSLWWSDGLPGIPRASRGKDGD
jgi:hypothetical protein